MGEYDQRCVLQGRSGFQQPDDLIPIQLGQTQVNKDGGIGKTRLAALEPEQGVDAILKALDLVAPPGAGQVSRILRITAESSMTITNMLLLPPFFSHRGLFPPARSRAGTDRKKTAREARAAPARTGLPTLPR